MKPHYRWLPALVAPFCLLSSSLTARCETAPAATEPVCIPFPMGEDTPNCGVADVSRFTEKPAGKNGRLRVDADGHFTDATGRRVRLLGTNITRTSPFSTNSTPNSSTNSITSSRNSKPTASTSTSISTSPTAIGAARTMPKTGSKTTKSATAFCPRSARASTASKTISSNSRKTSPATSSVTKTRTPGSPMRKTPSSPSWRSTTKIRSTSSR